MRRHARRECESRLGTAHDCGLDGRTDGTRKLIAPDKIMCLVTKMVSCDLPDDCVPNCGVEIGTRNSEKLWPCGAKLDRRAGPTAAR